MSSSQAWPFEFSLQIKLEYALLDKTQLVYNPTFGAQNKDIWT